VKFSVMRAVKIGFSPEYGFSASPWAVLGSQIIHSAFWLRFALVELHKGATARDLETEHVTRDSRLMLRVILLFSLR